MCTRPSGRDHLSFNSKHEGLLAKAGRYRQRNSRRLVLQRRRGYFDAEGYLYVHDRIKDMIISGGENIYPAEIESALASHPAIADVAIIGVPDEKWGESVKAVIVLNEGASLSEAELEGYSRERLADYKIPLNGFNRCTTTKSFGQNPKAGVA